MLHYTSQPTSQPAAIKYWEKGETKVSIKQCVIIIHALHVVKCEQSQH